MFFQIFLYYSDIVTTFPIVRQVEYLYHVSSSFLNSFAGSVFQRYLFMRYNIVAAIIPSVKITTNENHNDVNPKQIRVANIAKSLSL